MADRRIPATGRVLGLDWGTSRIGLACTDETQLIASPVGQLHRRAGKRLPLGQFLDVIEREHPVGLVVGLPLDAAGDEGTAAAAAREMAALFAERSHLPLEFADERYSTARAHGVFDELGVAAQGRRDQIDALAAAVMLQQWLEGRRNRRDG